MAEFTPMMKQYLKVKEQYKDAVLFYRLGDFYEMFFDDAVTASRELELVLTGRDCGQEERAPMCGVPFHAAEGYIARLVAKGYKVAICEQTEDPQSAKGLVSRDVIRVVTPGTVTESVMLDETKNNFLACVYFDGSVAGLSFCDISTGQLFVSELSGSRVSDRIINELARFKPSEILLNDKCASIKDVSVYIERSCDIVASIRDKSCFDLNTAVNTVTGHFKKNIAELDLGGLEGAVRSLGCLLSYLYETQKNTLANITDAVIYSESRFLSLDATARRNLELTENERRREKKGSLLWVLDKTKTAPGKRKLCEWIQQPLISVSAINARLDAVEELFNNTVLRSEALEKLGGINDLERIITRIVYQTANAKELRTLSQTLEVLPEIKALLDGVGAGMLKEVYDTIDTLDDIKKMIDASIVDEPPFSVREGGMIRKGCSEELDSLRAIVSGGKDFLTETERREQEKTGIKKLRIGYNRVFGYYIEVLNSYRDLVPDNYIRKQTLSNCERYITPELKDLEAKVLGAQDRIAKLEYELFAAVRDSVASEQLRIRKTAGALSTLDVLCSLARVAAENGYVRPFVDNSDVIEISGGRHPVVEKYLDGAPFVPNDTYLDGENNRTAIITGPNMAGKSTYMRQVAIIVIMAQMGSFVPAKSANIGIVDSVFTRVGASDDLAAGQSTFMTEMTEVSRILAAAGPRSLIILDEIGRGPSTFDGMSIARAVLEYVNDKKKIGAKTLFATHYHELTEIEGEIPGVLNYNTSVKKRGDDITFLRRIVRGPADGSYGIEVAKLSGIPQSVVNRAKVILKGLENSESEKREPRPFVRKDDDMQLEFFGAAESEADKELKMLDVNTLTPIEALNKLYELKAKLTAKK